MLFLFAFVFKNIENVLIFTRRYHKVYEKSEFIRKIDCLMQQARGHTLPRKLSKTKSFDLFLPEVKGRPLWHTHKRSEVIDHRNYRVAHLRLFFNIAPDQYGGVLGEYRRVNDAFSVWRLGEKLTCCLGGGNLDRYIVISSRFIIRMDLLQCVDLLKWPHARQRRYLHCHTHPWHVPCPKQHASVLNI